MMTNQAKPRTTRSTRAQSTGSTALSGSGEAKRQAVVLLEVLSGLRGPQEGSRALGISLNRYYQLERRALQGLIRALEPRPKGRQRTPESELEQLRQEKQRLGRELSRHQALLRAAQRSLGLPRTRSASEDSGRVSRKVKTGTKAKRRSRTVRATKTIAVLRKAVAADPAARPPVGASSS
jgi:hypothetical protein